MKCACGGHSLVLDSRAADAGEVRSVRRRRECQACNARFTTYETTIDPEKVAAAADRLQAALSASGNPSIGKPGRAYRRTLRAQARKESVKTGRPAEEIYRDWGVA